MLLLVYVDDILVTGSDDKAILSCIHELKQQFAIKDLGIEAQHSSKGIHLTQTKYLLDLLSKVNMINAKPCATPMVTTPPLSKQDSDSFDNPHFFRSVVGALQYATLTRSEIVFAVNKISQFMHEPTVNQWGAAKRILRYLCGTLHHGLLIKANSSATIHAHSDADWAGSIDDRRSTSGFCVYLGSNLVSWCAKKQTTISRSSTEAEYRSLAYTTTEIMWL
ncbi:hypothetical protein LUZ63_005848 [Rhynchospora breviuscula]|uniref:Reverse transcriptase Ty1/copia-type domain-containing protein n=1 Tax=Rhynchospora breviuscula TaxID=2022672 RepID=A0A9Q0CNX0_9POAL|nr:hypothetical protein LUZ63_005848 [Rhynchospora breviuscula]